MFIRPQATRLPRTPAQLHSPSALLIDPPIMNYVEMCFEVKINVRSKLADSERWDRLVFV